VAARPLAAGGQQSQSLGFCFLPNGCRQALGFYQFVQGLTVKKQLDRGFMRSWVTFREAVSRSDRGESIDDFDGNSSVGLGPVYDSGPPPTMKYEGPTLPPPEGSAGTMDDLTNCVYEGVHHAYDFSMPETKVSNGHSPVADESIKLSSGKRGARNQQAR
jgi:hypothetical protein